MTPRATEAQEIFLSELEGLLGATQATGAAAARTAGSGRGGGSGGGAAAAGSEAAYWKERFEELSAMRQTLPEEQLALFKKHAAERDQSSEKYIEQLRCACGCARVVFF